MKIMTEAARRAAIITLSSTPVGQIKPWRYRAAEARANRAALRAATKGDTAAALIAKRAELAQHELAREAEKVERDLERAEKRFKKLFRPDKKLAQTRDIDIIQGGRALLRSVQFRPESEGDALDKQNEALDKLSEDFPHLHAVIQGLRADLASQNYRELPLDQFRNVADIVKDVWELSQSSRLLEIEGRKMELTEASRMLQDAIAAQQERLAPGAKEKAGISPSQSSRVILKGWNMVASSKRFLHWVQFMDQKDPNGAFHELILRPMLTRIDKYRTRRNAIMERLALKLRSLTKQYGGRWDANIATDLPTEDGKGYVFRGVRELLDVLLDIGNQSNLEKRLVGEGWAPKPQKSGGLLDTSAWDAFFESQLPVSYTHLTLPTIYSV